MAGSIQILAGSRKTRVWVTLLCAGHLCLLLLVNSLPFPSLVWNDVLGWFLFVTAHWISIASVIWIALRVGVPTHFRWWFYAGSIALNSVGILLYLVRSFGSSFESHSPGLPLYFLILSSVPLIFGISLAFDNRETRLVRKLDVSAA